MRPAPRRFWPWAQMFETNVRTTTTGFQRGNGTRSSQRRMHGRTCCAMRQGKLVQSPVMLQTRGGWRSLVTAVNGGAKHSSSTGAYHCCQACHSSGVESTGMGARRAWCPCWTGTLRELRERKEQSSEESSRHGPLRQNDRQQLPGSVLLIYQSRIVSQNRLTVPEIESADKNWNSEQ